MSVISTGMSPSSAGRIGVAASHPGRRILRHRPQAVTGRIHGPAGPCPAHLPVGG
jgi:hypothetical protein